MRRPEDLYELLIDQVEADSPVLLHALSGFLDAGQAGRLAADHLLSSLDYRVVAAFDLDDLFDYRARRPKMQFVTDHYASVEMPTLELVEMVDTVGTPFLLLHGHEPDHAWERLSSAIIDLIDRFGVQLTVGIQAIPWPVPHTRPVDVTAHATDPALIRDHPPWVGSLEVPGHLAGLLELQLGDTGHDAMGFAAHVPHYLVTSEYPSASLELLSLVTKTTGLVFPTDALVESERAALAEVEAQIAENPENSAAVEALEAQYDSVRAAREVDGAMTSEAPDQVTEEDIAAQVERFLSDLGFREE